MNLLSDLVDVALGSLKTRLLELRECKCDLMNNVLLMWFYKAIKPTFRFMYTNIPDQVRSTGFDSLFKSAGIFPLK